MRWLGLVLVCLLAKVTAAPIITAGPSLTEVDFARKIERGSWLVEHYSPYCHHCRAFAPTWKSLVDSFEAEAGRHDFHFAQVDCAANGDLCVANEVKFYPSLFLYVAGVKTDQYKGERTVEALEAWIKDRWAVTTTWTASSEPDGEPKPALETAADEGARFITPDQIEGAASENDREQQRGKHALTVQEPPSASAERGEEKRSGSSGTVESLNTAGLERAKSSGRPIFVKFFAPWCSHCKAMAPAWKELAETLRDVDVYEVNCEEGDNSSLCRREGVKGFPTLYFYNGAVRADYSGKRTVESMKKWVEKTVASSSIRTLTSDRDVQEKVEREEVVLFYLVEEGSQTDQLAESVLREIVGSAPLFLTTRLLDHPRGSFVASRGGHLTSFVPPAHEGWRAKSQAAIEWARHSKLAPLTEITPATYDAVFPDRFAASSTDKPPLVALALIEQDDAKSKEAMKRMSTSAWGRDGVLWTWVDRKRWQRWISNVFGKQVTDATTIVFMDPASQKYWSKAEDDRPFDLDPSHLDAAIQAIKAGTLPGQTYRNIFSHFAEWVSSTVASVLSSSITFVVVLFVVAGIAIACSKKRTTRSSISSSSHVPGYAKRE